MDSKKKFEELINATTNYYGEALSKLAEGENPKDEDSENDSQE